MATAAVSTQHYRGAELTIDLGAPCLFNMVIIRHGPDGEGHCARVELLTSLDGTRFISRHIAPGTRIRTNLCPIRPILARYVRLRAVVPGKHRWSVAEVYLQ